MCNELLPDQAALTPADQEMVHVFVLQRARVHLRPDFHQSHHRVELSVVHRHVEGGEALLILRMDADARENQGRDGGAAAGGCRIVQRAVAADVGRGEQGEAGGRRKQRGWGELRRVR